MLGREFAVERLCALTELAPEGVRAELAHALSAGLLELGGEPERLCFTHGLVRDVLYEALPVLERARLHGRADASSRPARSR